MSQDISEHDLHAYLDGQLEPARRAVVEDYLERHPEEAARLRRYRDIDEGLRALFEPVAAEPVPERLLRPMARRRAPTWLQAAAVAGLMLFSGGAGWLVRGAETQVVVQTPQFPVMAVAAHRVYTPEVLHPVEVGAEQQEHLVKWLSKRLGGTVHAPDLHDLGYELLGGRLLPGEGAAAAQFMYEDGRGQRLTLYVRRDAGGAETAFRFAEQDGVRAFYWIDREFGYALSGEIDKGRLAELAEAVYRQVSP